MFGSTSACMWVVVIKSISPGRFGWISFYFSTDEKAQQCAMPKLCCWWETALATPTGMAQWHCWTCTQKRILYSYCQYCYNCWHQEWHAWRLNGWLHLAIWKRQQQKKASVKNFQLIVVNLEGMKKFNPTSVIVATRGDGFDILSFLFPWFFIDVLSFLHPVIILDTAHIRIECNGTLYIASVLSGNDDRYPISFMISTGNKYQQTCTKILSPLKQACPIMSDLEFWGIDKASERCTWALWKKFLLPYLSKMNRVTAAQTNQCF